MSNFAEDDNLIGRVKHNIIREISELGIENRSNNLAAIEKWFCSGEYMNDLEKYSENKRTDEKLLSIVKELREEFPLDGVLKTEKIIYPTSGPNSDCKEDTTSHIDEFLYDDDDIEELSEDNKFKNKYCSDCGSHNLKDSVIVSHSLSRKKLQYVFTVLLPKDCTDKRIIDVGSRIGAVLYGAYFYTKSSNIYGVELNKDLCDIQNKIISHFKMEDRVKLIHSDILKQKDLLSSCDIVILNNVFEFFVDQEAHIEIWKYLKRTLKKGCIMVTVPSVEETLDNLDVYEEFSDWLKIIPAFQQENNVMFDIDTTYFHDIYLYTVK